MADTDRDFYWFSTQHKWHLLRTHTEKIEGFHSRFLCGPVPWLTLRVQTGKSLSWLNSCSIKEWNNPECLRPSGPNTRYSRSSLSPALFRPCPDTLHPVHVTWSPPWLSRMGGAKCIEGMAWVEPALAASTIVTVGSDLLRAKYLGLQFYYPPKFCHYCWTELYMCCGCNALLCGFGNFTSTSRIW